MRIKRYSAKTEYEAMEQIKKDHGPEAYILHTKQVKAGGLFGFMKKPTVEILVGIEDEAPKNNDLDLLLKESATTKKELDEIKKSLAVLSETLANKEKEERELREKEAARLKAEAEEKAKALAQKEEAAEVPSVNKGTAFPTKEEVAVSPAEVEEGSLVAAKKHKKREAGPQTGSEIGSESQAEKKSDREEELIERLKSRGLSSEIAAKLIDQVKAQPGGQDLSDERAEKLLKIAIKNALGFPYKINKDEKKRKIFFFVGPTGVGKTTTIAKIAAKLSFIEGKDVALITADTFRIAAVDQLKTYGNILNIPINVVYKPIELEEALHKHEDCDFVLVDTAGRNHRDEKLKEYLESYLSVAGEAEIFLLVSLTTSKADLDCIADSYSFLEDYKLIFTKIDETISPGNILNVRMKTGKSTSFITNGQSVPDDIMLADPDEIARLIMGE